VNATKETHAMNPSTSPRKHTNAARRALAWALGCGAAVLVPLMAPVAASAFGTFSADDSYAAPGLIGQAAFGDLNGDGALDIAAAADEQPGDAGDGLIVYYGNGDGTLGTPLPIAAGDDPDGVAIGRFSGDRRRDIAVSAYMDNEISLLYRKKGGTFKHGPTLKATAGPTLLAGADLNRDGRTDLVSLNYGDSSAAISVWLQRSAGGFGARRDYPAPGSSFRGLAVGRLNADARPDVAVLSYEDDIAVRLTKRNGTLGPKRVTRDPGTAGYADLALADFNRDGKGDLVAGDLTNALHVRIGKGNGRFRDDTEIPLASAEPAAVASGDFNRDGKADIGIASYSPARVVMVPGKGNGKFGPESTPYPTPSNGFWLGAARLNADKGLDLVYGGRTTLDVFLNVP
jgi:hypothetical protein